VERERAMKAGGGNGEDSSDGSSSEDDFQESHITKAQHC
jgi:hypothetical protein